MSDLNDILTDEVESILGTDFEPHDRINRARRIVSACSSHIQDHIEQQIDARMTDPAWDAGDLFDD